MQIRKKLAGFTTVSVLGSVFLAWTTIHVPFAHVASASGALAFDYSPVGDSKFSNHTMFCSQLSVMHRTMHLRDIFELIRDTFLERFQSCPAQFAHDDVLWRWITHLLGAWVANDAAVSGEEIDLRSVALFGSTFVYPRGGGNSVVHGAVWHLMMSASSDDQLIPLGLDLCNSWHDELKQMELNVDNECYHGMGHGFMLFQINKVVADYSACTQLIPGTEALTSEQRSRALTSALQLVKRVEVLDDLPDSATAAAVAALGVFEDMFKLLVDKHDCTAWYSHCSQIGAIPIAMLSAVHILDCFVLQECRILSVGSPNLC